MAVNIVKSKEELGEGLSFHIEGLKRVGSALILHGWIIDPGMRLRSIALGRPGSSQSLELLNRIVRFERADVVAAFKADASSPLTCGGFAVAFNDIPDVAHLERLAIGFVSANGNAYVETVPIVAVSPEGDQLASLLGILPDMQMDAQRCERYYEPLFAAITSDRDDLRLAFDHTYNNADQVKSAPGETPVLSIIIPLYGPTRFERTQIPALAALRQHDWEIILAVDDPRSLAAVRDNAKRLSTMYGIDIRVLASERNLGFSGINNLASQHARADHLLFLNSDCFMSDATPIHQAMTWLHGEGTGAVGFRLLYPDRTVQHDGMSIGLWSDNRAFVLNEHPRRGLPANLVQKTPLHDRACMVTAACLLIRRETFHAVGGFDSIYLRGDFEDSDLCLKLMNQGLRLGIVRTNTMFHLERQTIVNQEGGVRQKITLVNSYIYSRRWQKLLTGDLAPLELVA